MCLRVLPHPLKEGQTLSHIPSSPKYALPPTVFRPRQSATKNDIDQAMLIYGRNDDGSIYEKEHITDQGVAGGWMQELLHKAMRFDISMEQMIKFARSETDIFKEDEGVEDEVLFNNLKQEWIDLLTEARCIIAFSEVTTSFNDLDGYSIVDFSEEE